MRWDVPEHPTVRWIEETGYPREYWRRGRSPYGRQASNDKGCTMHALAAGPTRGKEKDETYHEQTGGLPVLQI